MRFNASCGSVRGIGITLAWLLAAATAKAQPAPQKTLLAEDVFKNIQVLKGLPVGVPFRARVAIAQEHGVLAHGNLIQPGAAAPGLVECYGPHGENVHVSASSALSVIGGKRGGLYCAT